jgi:hypothetical protein
MTSSVSMNVRVALVAWFAITSSTSANATGDAPIEVPLSIAHEPHARRIVAQDLNNPRGVYVLADGSLLVAEAGIGSLEQADSSRLLQLEDKNRNGVYEKDERRALLDKLPSINILEHVRRDEVFGMAAIASGNGEVLATHAIFDGPSRLLLIDGDEVKTLGEADGNLNSIAWHPGSRQWVAASSSRNEVVRVARTGEVQVIARLPLLESDQEAVPAYVRFDPLTQDILVSLFSGSTEGETGGDGTELEPRSAKVIRIDPVTGRYSDVITGLTVPTDVEVDDAGRVYVLEFCDAFLDPMGKREQIFAGVSHGGFRRFSGRLLRIDRERRSVTVLAEGLDAPTNLTRAGNTLYISEGMGTPGRWIPGPQGKVPLTGFISAIDIGPAEATTGATTK